MEVVQNIVEHNGRKNYMFGKGFIKVTFQEGEITWETMKSLKGIKLFSLLRTQ